MPDQHFFAVVEMHDCKNIRSWWVAMIDSSDIRTQHGQPELAPRRRGERGAVGANEGLRAHRARVAARHAQHAQCAIVEARAKHGRARLIRWSDTNRS